MIYKEIAFAMEDSAKYAIGKTMWNLGLHEKLRIVDNNVEGSTTAISPIFVITRVPGGWLYEMPHTSQVYFVEYSDEFNPDKNNDGIRDNMETAKK